MKRRYSSRKSWSKIWKILGS